MVVARTSRAAYSSIKALGQKQTLVLETIEELGICNNYEIAAKLNWEINRVTGRVSELVRKGFVEFVRYGVCEQTGRTVKMWVVTTK